MNIEEALKTRLLFDPKVSYMVESRIWKGELPQSATLPAIVLQLTSTVPGTLLLEGAAGPIRSRVRVSAWALTRDAAHQLGEACRQALQSWSGMASGQAVNLTRFVDQFDDHEAGPPEWFRQIVDFYVLSMEGVAA